MSQQVQQQMQKFRDDVSKKLHEPNQVNNFLGRIEEKTGVDRFYMVAGVAGIFALYLVFGHFAELICNAIGFAYPAYVSIKAIESADKNDDTQWLTYWVVVGLFTVIEFATDFIVGWFPFYWLIKCVFLLYLHLPMTQGAQKLYQKVIRPFFLRHKDSIDAKLGQAFDKVSESAKNAAADHIKEN